ncbi:MAG: serine/threonine protein kinase [Pirellulales bacterium]|nr:serine/threonine protein kinase [Pirellulales bacterium]
MSAPATCPKCGTVLPADAPGGLCPQCLLAAGLASQSQASAAEEPMSTTDRSGAGRFVPPAPAELAAAFPQLEILELIGSGGMGAVYKARQPHLDRLVALKILPTQLAEDPAFEARFSREARTLARLSHPHIVAVYDFGTTQLPTTPATDRTPAQESRPLYYFLMEYVDGTNLRQLLRQGQLQPQQALAIVPQICEALQHAHDQGVVHRDIKPENILLDRQGRVKIADFGLAKIAEQPPAGEAAMVRPPFNLTATGQVMGTPHYMAPEQLRGTHDVDHRADIYSLGVVFYEMLTGELPLGKFAPPSRKVQVDVRLDEVVLRALESEPERRYQQASEVSREVETITSSSSRQRHPATSLPSLTAEEKEVLETARRQVRWPAFALTVVGCLAPALGVAAIIFGTLTSSLGEVWLSSALALVLFESVLGLFLVVSAGRIRALESYWLALAGPILAIIPWVAFFYLVRLPIGLWALVVLTKANVRAAFKQVARPAEAGVPVHTSSAARKSKGRRIPSIALLILVAVTAGWFGWTWWQDRTDPNGKVWVLFPSDSQWHQTPGLHMYRYKVRVPHGYRLELFSELWAREPLPENVRPPLVWMAGLGNGTFELRLEEGSRLLPQDEGQLRWTLAYETDHVTGSDGEWSANPFKETGIWPPSSSPRFVLFGPFAWFFGESGDPPLVIPPGETRTILVLRGVKKGGPPPGNEQDYSNHDALAQAIQRGEVPRSDVEFYLKARLRPARE